MSWVARAIEIDETRGLMKAVVDTSTKEILGCAMLAVEGGEMMSAMQLAMMGRLTYPQVRETIFAHPTFAEALNNLFLSMEE
jgi:pyruvate/2-oxoglutarate dehydrogenase complex dihydrolipoamide dehydrogenase (E3) component